MQRSSRTAHWARRAARWAAGACRNRARSRAEIARSCRGRIQAGVRWNATRPSTSPAIAGTTWMALAPVPTMATRRPRRSRSAGQRAVCTTGPAKLSSPGIAGADGSLSPPPAETTTFARTAPWVVSTRQACSSSTHSARVDSQPKTVRSSTPCSRATRRR